MVPMPPMPYAIVTLGHSPAQRIGGSAPNPDSLLACQHETRRASAGETAEIGGEILAPEALRIGDALDGFVKFCRPDRTMAVVPVPRLEKLGDPPRRPRGDRDRRRPHEIVDTVDRADVVVLADAVDVDAVDATVVHGSKLLRRPTKKPAQPAEFPSLGVLGRRGLSTGG
jgi:hypothetical protein